MNLPTMDVFFFQALSDFTAWLVVSISVVWAVMHSPEAIKKAIFWLIVIVFVSLNLTLYADIIATSYRLNAKTVHESETNG